MANLLVVEDEQSLLQTLRYNLSRAGHEVRLCTDGVRTAAIWFDEGNGVVAFDSSNGGNDSAVQGAARLVTGGSHT